MKVLLFLVSWLLAGCLSLSAQSEATLRGVVVTKIDGSPVEKAVVDLEGPVTLEVETGAGGRFSFQRVIPGVYTVAVTRSGFREEQRQITLKPREVAAIELRLSLTAITQSVEVREDRNSETPTYSPSSTVLQQDTVDQFPVARTNNVTDMIAATTPGMVRSHDDFVHVRGHEIALNTSINGVSFWENPHSALSAGLTPEIIQSANVLTGGFPAEYGNRFGGVVDIVTKSGFTQDNEGSLTVGAGTALRHNAAVEYGGHTGNAGYYVYSSGFESARFLSPNDTRSIHDTGRGTHNFLQLDFGGNSRDLLKLIVMGDGADFEIPRTATDDQFRPNLKATQQTRGTSVILTWNHASRGAAVTTSLYQRWSSMSLKQGNEPLASVAFNDRKLSTTGIKSDVTRFLGRHTLKAGIDLVRLQPNESLVFDGNGYSAFAELLDLPDVPVLSPVFFSRRQTGGQVSSYIQDSFQWGRRLSINAGVRFDHYDLAVTASHFSPRVNLSYRLSEDGTALHASYDHFFVPPAVENVLISSAGLTRGLEGFAEPLPALQPIVENQVELGVSHPFARSLSVVATGYYRKSRKPVHTVLFPDTRVYTYANFDKGKAYGLEIKTQVPVVTRIGLSAYLNYALSRVYFWNPATAGFVDEIDHLEDTGRFLAPMDQTHTLNAGFTYRNQETGLWTSMTFEYGSGTPVETEEDSPPGTPRRVPGHFTEDFTVGADVLKFRDRPWLSLQFNIENLTNNVYKVSQESAFSPGEYYNPRFFSSSLKIRF